MMALPLTPARPRKVWGCAAGLLWFFATGCRVLNPGFGLGEGLDVERQDTTTAIVDEDSTQPVAAETGTKPGDSQSTTPKHESTDSSSQSVSTAQSSSTTGVTSMPKPDVPTQNICEKGAGYCYDMKDIQNGVVQNRSGLNPGVTLQVSSPVQTSDSSSLTFGSLLRLGAASSLQTSNEIKFPKGGDFGVDVWFTPDWGTDQELMLFVLGDLMTIKLDNQGGATCNIFVVPGEKPIPIFASNDKPSVSPKWRMVACFVHQREPRFWHVDQAATHFSQSETKEDRFAVLEIGSGSSPLAADEAVKPFKGDIHMVRIWTNTQWMMETIREELRYLGKDPPN